MTKEEAVHILRDSKPSTIMKEGKVFERVANVCIAIDMAIESLKRTPCYLDSPCEYQNPDIKIQKHQCFVWHPYAKVKPSENKIYLVTYHYVDCNGKPTDATTYAEFKKGHFHNVPRVTAWAELPEPYRKENAE